MLSVIMRKMGEENTEQTVRPITDVLGKPEDIVIEGGQEVRPEDVPGWVLKGIADWKGWVLLPNEGEGHFDLVTCYWTNRDRVGSLQESTDFARERGVTWAAKVFKIKKGDHEALRRTSGWGVQRVAVGVEEGSSVDSLWRAGRGPQDLRTEGSVYTSQQLRAGARRLDEALARSDQEGASLFLPGSSPQLSPGEE